MALTASAEEKTGHLFILSGQSNMTGNLKNGFATTVTRALGAENVTIVHHCKPGRGIRFWVKDYELPEEHPLHGKLKGGNGEEFPRLVELVKNAGDVTKFKTVSFIWMQGESDANRDLGVAYEQNFKKLTEQLKKETGIQQMYFVIGRISDHGLNSKSAEGWKRMREIQQKIAESDPLGQWIDTDDLNGKDAANPNGILHYPSAESVKLGERFGEAALKQLVPAEIKK
jgi:hypothetical protein